MTFVEIFKVLIKRFVFKKLWTSQAIDPYRLNQQRTLQAGTWKVV